MQKFCINCHICKMPKSIFVRFFTTVPICSFHKVLLLLLHTFNDPFLGQPRWTSTCKVKPIWILLKQETCEWQWHQLGHMQVCTSLQRDKHASTPPLSFLQAGCPSCHPTNNVKALNAEYCYILKNISAAIYSISVIQTSPSPISICCVISNHFFCCSVLFLL